MVFHGPAGVQDVAQPRGGVQDGRIHGGAVPPGDEDVGFGEQPQRTGRGELLHGLGAQEPQAGVQGFQASGGEDPRGDAGAHGKGNVQDFRTHLTAPAVSPDFQKRCSMMNASSSGMMESSEPVITMGTNSGCGTA